MRRAQLLSQVARTVGRELIKARGGQKLTRQAIKQFRAQLIALLADGIPQALSPGRTR
ncbi:MAG: hypothetical protein HS111_19125 [Kofleriaceae bacterium]|nr:hypothetical protein [Kofleriaceae bacterium]